MTKCRFLLVLILLCAITEGSRSDSLANLKKNMLKDIRNNESLIKNFEVEFTIRWYNAEGKKEQPKGNNNVIIEERWHYARELNKIYAKLERDWSNKYTEKGIQVYDGKYMEYYREDLHSGLIRSQRKFPTSTVPDRFTNLYRNVGDMTMSEFLKASTIKHVQPCQIKGHRGFMVHLIHCNSSIVTPLEQKIYFDSERGFVPATVETYRLDISTNKPVVVAEVLDFIEVAEGIYFPKKARLVSYFKRDEQGNPMFSSEVHCEISEVKVNTDLPKDMFELRYPNGTHIYDETINRSYTVGRSGDPALELRSLVGKVLPNLNNVLLSAEQTQGKLILVCFFDINQRPSRGCITQLAKQAEQLKNKDVAVIAVHASKMDQKALNQWIEKNRIPFPVRMVQGDAEKTRLNWGVESLPWLILTDSKHFVRAEGFALNELEAKIQQINGG